MVIQLLTSIHILVQLLLLIIIHIIQVLLLEQRLGRAGHCGELRIVGGALARIAEVVADLGGEDLAM